MTVSIAHYNANDKNFIEAILKHTAWDQATNDKINGIVSTILEQVKKQGDSALLNLTKKLDQRKICSFADLKVDQKLIADAEQSVSTELYAALQQAKSRIHSFHTKQKQTSWDYRDEFGNLLGQKVTPLERVGIYVPGGTASYPSSVLMNAIPARVAGVKEIVMVSPAPKGVMSPAVLAAAKLAGISELYSVGGAQAVAALAFGTETIKPVDIIVGPGNIYVAAAKKQLFGQVGLDMLAGPSEILVICDGSANPDWIAMDLFSQAEHDEQAQAILMSSDAAFLEKVLASVNKLLPEQPRADIIRKSLEDRGAFILVDNIEQAIDISNRIAPEHLELAVENPQKWVANVKHAGAVFVGKYTPESFGDYCAGPSHVLPTSGSARFSSPLDVHDFQKKTSIIQCSESGAKSLQSIASDIAKAEGLFAHAQASNYRK